MNEIFEGMSYGPLMQEPNNHSSGIRLKRYKRGFFTGTLFKLYPTLHFICLRFGFEVRGILELLLEGLYTENEFEEFIRELSRFTQLHQSIPLDCALLGVTVNGYIKERETHPSVVVQVALVLKEIAFIESAMQMKGYRRWKFSCFYLRDLKEVKLYNEAGIHEKIRKMETVKLTKELNGSIVKEYVKHLKQTSLHNDPAVNHEIENLLTIYYAHYCKKLLR